VTHETGDVRQVIERIANWPDAEMFTSLAPAHAMRALAREALESLTAQPSEVERRFPVQNGPDIPWSVIAPFEKQARKQHGGQTLEQLAARQGLSVCEVLSVLEGGGNYDAYWCTAGRNVKDITANILRLQALVAERSASSVPQLERERAAFQAGCHARPCGDDGWTFDAPSDSQARAAAEAWTAYRPQSAEARLTSHPAPSGWQQRIAAMEPLLSSHDGFEVMCRFCGSYDGHKPDCLWQHAVDALPPAPEVKDATDEEVNSAIDDLAAKAKRLYRGSDGHSRGVFAEIDRKSEMLKRMLNTPADMEDAIPPGPEGATAKPQVYERIFVEGETLPRVDGREIAEALGAEHVGPAPKRSGVKR
jgi:hypothetical protein